jgi:hypothetical protein
MVDNDYKTNLKELYKCHCCYQNSMGRVTIVHWSGCIFFGVVSLCGIKKIYKWKHRWINLYTV